MCIKVHEDEVLRRKNQPRPDTPAAAEDTPSFGASVEWARSSAAASAAILSLGPEQPKLHCGDLPAGAHGLVGAVDLIARPAVDGCDVRLQVSWGEQPSMAALALVRRFGLRSAALLSWTGAGPIAWLLLVDIDGAESQRVG